MNPLFLPLNPNIVCCAKATELWCFTSQATEIQGAQSEDSWGGKLWLWNRKNSAHLLIQTLVILVAKRKHLMWVLRLNSTAGRELHMTSLQLPWHRSVFISNLQLKNFPWIPVKEIGSLFLILPLSTLPPSPLPHFPLQSTPLPPFLFFDISEWACSGWAGWKIVIFPTTICLSTGHLKDHRKSKKRRGREREEEEEGRTNLQTMSSTKD